MHIALGQDRPLSWLPLSFASATAGLTAVSANIPWMALAAVIGPILPPLLRAYLDRSRLRVENATLRGQLADVRRAARADLRRPGRAEQLADVRQAAGPGPGTPAPASRPSPPLSAEDLADDARDVRDENAAVGAAAGRERIAYRAARPVSPEAGAALEATARADPAEAEAAILAASASARALLAADRPAPDPAPAARAAAAYRSGGSIGADASLKP